MTHPSLISSLLSTHLSLLSPTHWNTYLSSVCLSVSLYLSLLIYPWTNCPHPPKKTQQKSKAKKLHPPHKNHTHKPTLSLTFTLCLSIFSMSSIIPDKHTHFLLCFFSLACSATYSAKRAQCEYICFYLIIINTAQLTAVTYTISHSMNFYIFL